MSQRTFHVRLRKFLDAYPVGHEAPFTQFKDEIFNFMGTRTPPANAISTVMRQSGFKPTGQFFREGGENCSYWRRER